MFQKLKQFKILKDAFWTMMALGIFNVILQFLVYPFLNQAVGSEEYGNILFYISIINIVAVSIGASVNNRRMVASAFAKTGNAEYNIFMGLASVLFLPLCFVVSIIFKADQTAGQTFLFWILMCLTAWRYYADVDFRLHLNYKGYFIYYSLIGLGYLSGLFLFQFTSEWTLVLIPGEMTGLLYVAIKENVFKKATLRKEDMIVFVKAVVFLIASQLLIQLVFNSDRFILKILCGGVAVTIYYISSLMGKTIALLSTPLNSVIIGYLAKSKKEMTTKNWIRIVILCIGMIILALFACVVASYIFIRILYPKEFEQAAQYFVVANLAQIVYFTTGILTTILLRYVKEKYQLFITLAYIITFAIIVLPVTWKFGLNGFAYSILIVNMFRFFYVFMIMLRKIQKKQISCDSLG